jgi:hypothetical protein
MPETRTNGHDSIISCQWQTDRMTDKQTLIADATIVHKKCMSSYNPLGFLVFSTLLLLVVHHVLGSKNFGPPSLFS